LLNFNLIRNKKSAHFFRALLKNSEK
jgi:hypothetical protein